jgi:hypothetical protein
MFKLRIETGRAYGESEKYLKCESCGHEMKFVFSNPYNCEICFKPMINTQKVMEKRLNNVSMSYTIKWHFSDKRQSVW